ncbi:Zinc finger MYM-type protein 1 [Merluccius polli]|uniref:Zinc finger MYM-type protein 1 n=1 Tax=Merluccius polli TaxID=89951 RepID=A0AA47PBQ3_MERPO|nr:Zinc finger MYM-type protein 1 [Merluccius polli]
MALNHGHFLEMILLLSKFDVSLQEHVSACMKKSKSLKETVAKGRGSLITLLSNTSVNKVIDIISHLIKENISREVREARMFSVQIDTTQDVTSTDQCAVVLRYVTDMVHEKLIGVVSCESSTGEYFVQLLKETLAKVDIDIRNCVGNFTDGTANMQGQYKGFSTLLSSESPNQVHIWCYAHVLNLVLGDTTGVVIESASIFSIVNDVAVFIKDSYKRMNMWEKVSDDRRHRRLSPIGETRWWAKDQALSKIFGCFGNPDNALFVDLILTLKRIVEDMSMKAHVRARAKGYIESLLKHETVLTAEIFLRIFEITSPLSRYLQTSNMDLITAHRLVMGAIDSLKTCTRDMDGVTKAANVFAEWANKKLEESGSKDMVQVDLPEIKIRKRKTMPGEVAEEWHELSAEDQYRVKVHNIILDTVTESIQIRFSANGALYDDFACLDPRNFGTLRERGLPSESLQQLSKCLLRFDDRATPGQLKDELCSLASHWERLKLPHLESYTVWTAEETEN